MENENNHDVKVKIIVFHATDEPPRKRAESTMADLLNDGYEIERVLSLGDTTQVMIIMVKDGSRQVSDIRAGLPGYFLEAR